jgi:PAS domain S-box-containing protein
MSADGTNSERVLVLAPIGRDAEVAVRLLREASLDPHICTDIAHLCRELDKGAGLAVVAEEAVATTDLTALLGWMKDQPPWSDLPIVLLTGRGDAPGRNPAAQRLQDILGNVNFLERPFHPTTLVSVARSALRVRRRQYQARALLEDLRAGEERLRLFIEHAPAAIVMLDRDLRYLAVSRRWMHDFHLSGTLIGRSHLEVFPEMPEAWRQQHQRCLAGAIEKTDSERFHRADGTLLWLKREVRPWRDTQGNIGGLVISWEDITAARDAAEHQKLLSRELQHRTKNLMAVIQSIATGSFPAKDPRADAFRSRLRALADVQNILTDASWGGALIEDVMRRELASFGDRISLAGPRVLLRSNAVQGFALVLHELATNAAKHGALSVAEGRVSVRWSVEDSAPEPSLVFQWQERGGPPATPPLQKGFGSVLLEYALSTPDCPPRFDYAAEGFTYDLKAALAIAPLQDEDQHDASATSASAGREPALSSPPPAAAAR